MKVQVFRLGNRRLGEDFTVLEYETDSSLFVSLVTEDTTLVISSPQKLDGFELTTKDARCIVTPQAPNAIWVRGETLESFKITRAEA